jgi:hypothetical protein
MGRDAWPVLIHRTRGIFTADQASSVVASSWREPCRGSFVECNELETGREIKVFREHERAAGSVTRGSEGV